MTGKEKILKYMEENEQFLIDTLSYSDKCPNQAGLEEFCNNSCSSCWEKALNREIQNELSR